MKSKLFLLIFVLMVGKAMAFPDPTVSRLSNGVTVVTVEDPSATITSSYVFVRTGSLFESPWIGSGMSHFLEHLVAGGTTSFRSESDYRQLIDELGGVSNAYTTYDHTAYYIKSSSKNSPKALQALYEWVTAAQWTSAEYKREQGVVLKEMSRSDNNVRRQIYYNVQERYYKDSPYRYPVIGYRDRFLQISSEQLMYYYKSSYVAENFIVVVAGNVSHQDVLSQVNKTFGVLPMIPPQLRYHSSQLRVLSPSKEYVQLPKVNSQRVVIRYPIPSFFHSDVYPLDLFAYILGTGQQSLLYQEFVSKRQLATSVSVNSITPSHDFGYFEIALETDASPNEILTKVQSFLDRFVWQRVSERVLQKARRQKQNEYRLSNSTLDDHVQDIGQAMIMGQNPLFFEFYSTNFNNVSANDINHVVKKYLNESKRQVVIIDNKSPSKNVISRQELIQPVVEDVNGVRYIVSKELNENIARVSIQFEGGIEYEQADQLGVGFLSALLLGKKAVGISRANYQNAFESRGAQLSASSNHNSLSYTLLATSDDIPDLLPLFIRGLTQADISDELFAEAKEQLLKAIDKKSESWFEESFDALKSQLFSSDSPYHFPLKGTANSVSKLTKDQVAAYIQKRITQSKVTVIVQANNPVEIKQSLTSLFSIDQDLVALDNQPKFTAKKLVNHQLKQPVGVVLRVDQLKQPITTVSEWLKVKLVDAILSGMRYPSGLLHQRLRGGQLVYVVHTLPVRFGEADMLFTYALTEPHQVTPVWQIVDQSFKEIRTQITPTQLALAKAQVMFDFQSSYQDPTQKGRLFVEFLDRFNAFPVESELQKEIDQITIQDVKETVNEAFEKPYIALFNKDESNSDDNSTEVR